MHEETPETFEEGPESIPTLEEVQEVFERLGVGKYEDVRRLEDEQGLYLWDIRVFEEDAEYSYMRKGQYDLGGQASTTAIHVIFFDEEGTPVGEHSVAKLINGHWELTP